MYHHFDDWHAASLASSPEIELPDRSFDYFHPSPDRKKGDSGMFFTSWPAASPNASCLSVPSEFGETPMQHVFELSSPSRFPPPKPESSPTCSVAARVSAKQKQKLRAQLEPGQEPKRKQNKSVAQKAALALAATATSTAAAASEHNEGAAEVASTQDGEVASTEGGDGDNTAAPGAPAAKKKAKQVVELGEKRKPAQAAQHLLEREDPQR